MSRSWIVLKFGGTSVASAARWQSIAERIRLHLPEHRVWVVASAIAGVSNDLERAVRDALADQPSGAAAAVREAHRRLAAELALDATELAPVDALLDQLDSWLEGIRRTGEAPPRLVARIMGIGELASTRLGAAGLARMGIPARWVDARGLLTTVSSPRDDDHQRYLEARMPPVRSPEAAEREAEGAEVVLTQGFIARTPEGDACVLGRGGSDTSGALFAALLDAARLEIHTDVPGLFTADPRLVPSARVVRRIGYREAQELAAMGAKVIHPRCIEPVAWAGIPLSIHSTEDPALDGTLIDAAADDHPAVIAVTCRTNVTLVTLSTLVMWGAPGFLARAFAPFEQLGISVDLVATSQAAVSVTLDKIPGGVNGSAFARLIAELERIGRVKVVHPCAVVSIVGRRIRTALHEIGSAMEVFRERRVYMISDSSEDLNLSFVVEEQDARPLVVRLHETLFSTTGAAEAQGATWEQLQGEGIRFDRSRAWWVKERERLLDLVRDGRARYVYHLPTVREQARVLRRTLPSVARVYYSMKANPHEEILAALVAEGFGLECVSAAEVRHARTAVGAAAPVAFTPNFCPMHEYRAALEAGAEVTIDGPEALEACATLFAGRAIGVRIDPGRGLGHHEKVRTAGARSKFGHPLEDADRLLEAAARAGARITGLHAHVGSGIFDPLAWEATGRRLATLLDRFTDVEWIDLGGGLGVPERPGQAPLDLAALERTLSALRRDLGRVELRLEPGRFLVSEAGVLVAPVTQVRTKRDATFVGVSTGMNSLIRPALYGAWHGIHNLSRLDEPPSGYSHVVGPICETGDVLGRDRLLPATRPGDIMLVENAGAYGAVMSSRYNLREPAEEVVLEGSRGPQG